MAYMVSRKQKCKKCGKAATQEVFNRFNDSTGFFCLVCASREVGRLDKAENS